MIVGYLIYSTFFSSFTKVAGISSSDRASSNLLTNSYSSKLSQLGSLSLSIISYFLTSCFLIGFFDSIIAASSSF
jgi:hypothetical protein